MPVKGRTIMILVNHGGILKWVKRYVSWQEASLGHFVHNGELFDLYGDRITEDSLWEEDANA